MKKFLLVMLTLSLLLGTLAAFPILAAEDDAPAAEEAYAGTLTYTPSDDGREMTISYVVGGETVSYTVPNNQNYLFGGYAGVDDLGRSLYSSEEVGAYGSAEDDRYVGLFYFLWLGEHGDSGIFNMQQIIDEVGVEAAGSTACGKYGPLYSMHFFAEPLYGYYYSNDAWVMRKHAELLTNANIDFLFFDVANGYAYLHNALQLMEILHELNEQGYDAPQVVFHLNTESERVAKELYDNIYNADKFSDTWFCVDDKPVIIVPDPSIMLDDATALKDVFTVKRTRWPNAVGYDFDVWPWMDFEWPQHVYRSKDKTTAINVSAAQHSGNGVNFSLSSLYGEWTNRGRSYVNEEGCKHTSGNKYNETLSKSYKAWQANPDLSLQGLNFQAQFDYAIKSGADYVLVTAWNEWTAQRQKAEGNRINFIDAASMEFSRDTEMMRGGYFDNYYMQLVYNVQRLKGTAPVVVQDARKPVDIGGSFDQWADVSVAYKDPVGDTANRNATGFGKQTLTNESGRNDIVSAKVLSDKKNLYFYAETADPITAPDADSSWMQLYLDSDADASTGWYGYDYIVNYAAKDGSTTTVAKYSGTDNAFSFETVGEVSYRAEGNQMMIAVPQSMLGIETYYEIELQFKWADSKTAYDEMEDFYCDGDVAPLGRLNFVYQNYIEGKSTPPATETESETTAVTPAGSATETPAESVTETPDRETATETAIHPTEDPAAGCASALVGTAAWLSLAAAAFVYCKRRK